MKPLPLQIFENEPTQPPIGLTPSIFNTGPYIIKNVGQQQIVFNPSWSLKKGHRMQLGYWEQD